MSPEQQYNAQQKQQAAPGWQSAAVLGRSMAAECEPTDASIRKTPPIERSVSLLGDNLGVMFDEVMRLENRIDSVLGPDPTANGREVATSPTPPTCQLNSALEEAIRRVEMATERLRLIRSRVEL